MIPDKLLAALGLGQTRERTHKRPSCPYRASLRKFIQRKQDCTRELRAHIPPSAAKTRIRDYRNLQRTLFRNYARRTRYHWHKSHCRHTEKLKREAFISYQTPESFVNQRCSTLLTVQWRRDIRERQQQASK